MPHGPTKLILSVIVFASLISAGCAGDAPQSEWSGSVQDSAGVRVVHNPAEGLWCAADGWSFTEVLSVGADVGDPRYEFGRISDIRVGADGSIFVFDPVAREIRVFDGAGDDLRTIGRSGEGPGEFSGAANTLLLTEAGQVAVPDPGNGRISWLSLEGEEISTVPSSYNEGFPVLWDAGESGAVLVQRRAMGGNTDPDLAAGDPLVRIHQDGS